MNTRVFLRRPDVPGFCPSIGVVGMVLIVIGWSLLEVARARPRA